MKHYIKGRFGGILDSSKEVNLWHIFRWKVLQAPWKTIKHPETIPLKVNREADKLTQSEDFICWLSHASFLIQLGGKRILIDPVFGNIPFYKRQIDFPYGVEELGNVDYLLISHAHYDHFDKPSIQAIASKSPKAIIPLKMSTLVHKIAPQVSTQELDWYQDFEIDDLTITLVPARHWSRRGVLDTNRILWGGYIIRYKDKTIYFAGDTASGTHFTEIGQRYDIDFALLPIGAYKPEFVMKANHLNPQEAYEAFKQLQAKTMVPMHYGTFKLSDEPLDEPLQWMQQIEERENETFCMLSTGEVFTL